MFPAARHRLFRSVARVLALCAALAAPSLSALPCVACAPLAFCAVFGRSLRVVLLAAFVWLPLAPVWSFPLTAGKQMKIGVFFGPRVVFFSTIYNDMGLSDLHSSLCRVRSSPGGPVDPSGWEVNLVSPPPAVERKCSVCSFCWRLVWRLPVPPGGPHFLVPIFAPSWTPNVSLLPRSLRPIPCASRFPRILFAGRPPRRLVFLGLSAHALLAAAFVGLFYFPRVAFDFPPGAPQMKISVSLAT